MGLTAQELFDGIGASERFRGRVHWVRSVPFPGVSGHLYIMRRRSAVSFADLARVTRASGNVEVCLMRMDGVPVFYIGSRGIAVATVWVPTTDSGIESFEWVAHTHPLEMESAEEGVARGPTSADRLALERIHERWGQVASTVVVCRGGAVVDTVEFAIERDLRVAPGTGRLWRPGD